MYTRAHVYSSPSGLYLNFYLDQISDKTRELRSPDF